MKKVYLFLFTALIAVSCSNTFSDADLAKLNGYWEIEEVVMPDGKKKEYTVNPTIDHFELKGKTGKRTKVMPQFDGTYRTNDLSEKISITEADGKTYIIYVTDNAEWKEELVKLTDDKLVVRNEQKIEYHYKKPEPFSIK